MPSAEDYVKWLDMLIPCYERDVDSGWKQASQCLVLLREWRALLENKDVFASEAANLVRRTDAAQYTIGDVAFFCFCNDVRGWYQRLYEQELDQVFAP